MGETDFDECVIRVAPGYLELTEGEQVALHVMVRVQLSTVGKCRSQFHTFASHNARNQ